MSWDKNTYNLSDIDSKVQILKELNVPFVVQFLADVKAMGMNDTYEDRDTYPLRLLKYSAPNLDSSVQNATNKDVCFVEQMHRTYDCDTDDTILSIPIDLNNVPEKFPLEIYLDAEGHVDLGQSVEFDGNLDSIDLDKLECCKPCPKEENIINLKKIIEEL